jgi:crossover junction endodeoxyribonuclease RuvC
MRILGIDPGFSRVGFGIIEFVHREWEMIDYGVITTSPEDEFSVRLLQVYEDISALLDEYQPTALALEQLFFMQNVTNGIQVAEARGVITLAAVQHDVFLYEYAPNEIKCTITGYGQADKTQMQKMVQTLLRLPSIPKPDDAADALAVALACGFDTVRL